jgi:hypothetical protein
MNSKAGYPRRIRAAAVAAIGAAFALIPGGAWGKDRQGTLAFLYGRYDVADPRFESVYPAGGAMLGGALTASLFAHLEVGLEIKTLSRRGTLTYTKEETRFRLVPVSLSLRYVYPGGIFQPFAGGGLDYNVYYEKNPIGTTANAARGAHAEAGLYIQFERSVPILLIAKARRVWATADKDGRAVELGGWDFSGGLALAF